MDQQEELLQTKFWCRYAARMVWGQARIVIPICSYVIAFKDGVLGGVTAGIVVGAGLFTAFAVAGWFRYRRTRAGQSHRKAKPSSQQPLLTSI